MVRIVSIEAVYFTRHTTNARAQITQTPVAMWIRVSTRLSASPMQVDTEPLFWKRRPGGRRAGACPLHVPRDPTRDERLSRFCRADEHGLGYGGEGNQGGRRRRIAGNRSAVL